MRIKQLSALLCLLFLSACGFTPVYQTANNRTTAREKLDQIYISNIPNRLGQKLKNHLLDRLVSTNTPKNPGFILDVHLEKTEIDLGFQKDATSTRKQLNLWAIYKLSKNGKELTHGKARSLVSYNKIAAQYGTVAAQENAEDRSIKEVGEQIINKLNLYFSDKDNERMPVSELVQQDNKDDRIDSTIDFLPQEKAP